MRDYSEISKTSYGNKLDIRFKYKRESHEVEYYDGVRINPETLPEGKHLYHTRHSDTDITQPLTIAPEGVNIIVNFCGSIVTDKVFDLKDETKLTYVSWF